MIHGQIDRLKIVITYNVITVSLIDINEMSDIFCKYIFFFNKLYNLSS